MKPKQPSAFLVASAIVGFSVIGCIAYREPTKVSTPMPPITLSKLPHTGQVHCSKDPNLNRGSYVIWELPGIPPGPNSSSGSGILGREKGLLLPCSEAKITDYAWSETDQDFYLFIEQGEAKGWIKMEFMDLK